MTTSDQLGSVKHKRTFLESIPDVTVNWGKSQVLLWLFVGLLLGMAVAAQSTTFEYDFSHIFDRFTVPECDPGNIDC